LAAALAIVVRTLNSFALQSHVDPCVGNVWARVSSLMIRNACISLFWTGETFYMMAISNVALRRQLKDMFRLSLEAGFTIVC
jgi:hypothetical protein